MPNLRLADLTAEIEANVRRALLEDIGSGDITAQLIPAERLAKATIITRDDAVICGTAWDFSNPSRVDRRSLDLLVIDEAGQFSLAATVAASMASGQ